MKKTTTNVNSEKLEPQKKYYWEDHCSSSIVAKTKVSKKNRISLAEANILMVEDDPANLKTMELGLRNSVKKIIKAENGLEALAHYQNNKIDLVILDLNLPLMGGIEVCKEIRKLEAGQDIQTPIITHTAHYFSDHKEKALEAGTSAFLTKPFAFKTLLSLLKEYL